MMKKENICYSVANKKFHIFVYLANQREQDQQPSRNELVRDMNKQLRVNTSGL